MADRTKEFGSPLGIGDGRLDRRTLLRGAAAAGIGAGALLASRRGQDAARAQTGACTGGDVEITYGYWNADQTPAIEAQIEAFRESHPNVTVSPQVVPFADYFTKLQTGIAGGSSYDVFWMNGPNFPVYASQGALVDLSTITGGGGVDPASYPESLISLYSYEDKLYGMPRDIDTIGLYYNKDLFDAAGVAYPTADWTWDDLRAAAEQLTDADSGRFGYGSTLSAQQNLYNFIYQNGGRIISEDGTSSLLTEPAACDAILFVTDMVLAGFSPDVATQQSNNPYQTLFPAGQIAIMPGGSWHAGRLHEANPAIAVAPLPKKVKQAAVGHGIANVVWSGSQHQCEALEFVKFLGSQQGEQILAETATVIPAMNGLQETWKAAVPEMDLQVFLDAINYSVPYPTAPGGAEWEGNLNEVMIQAWSGEIPRDQICQRAAEAVNAALQPAS
jgi:multiple sugar transport system substrate-binding protein